MGNLGGLAAETGRFALSAQGRQSVVVFWDFAAFVANSLVFLLIGLAMADAATRGAGFGAGAHRGRRRGWRSSAAPRLSIRSRSPSPARAGRSAGARRISCGGAGCAAPWRWRWRWRCRPTAPYRDAILVGAFAVVAFSALVQGLTAGPALRALRLDGKRRAADAAL